MESSEKLRRALRSQARKHHDIKFLQGDKVFYKQEDVKRWGGPGDVIGQVGSKVLIKIPTGHISVHSSRVMLTSDAEKDRMLLEDDKLEKETRHDDENNTLIQIHVNEQHDGSYSDENVTTQMQQPRGSIDSETIPNSDNQLNNPEAQDVSSHSTDNIAVENTADSTLAIDITSDQAVVDSIDKSNDDNSNEINEKRVADSFKTNIRMTESNVPKINQCVEYKLYDSDVWKHCRIISRAGKKNGKYSSCRNVEHLDDNSIGVEYPI